MKSVALAGIGGAVALKADSAAAMSSNPTSSVIRSSHVEQWDLQEITLSSHNGYRNPFKEVTLQCTFSAGSHSVTVHGFYDGDFTWKLRFMPDALGRWAFTTKSNDPSLDGQQGEFDVISARNGNHGPVHVANRFHFSYADGTPYYPLGTTAYQLFQQSREAQVRNMGTLARTAFSKVRLFVMPFSSLSSGACPFLHKDDSELDFEQYDIDFFRRYEAGLLDLQALGIEADLILFHPYDMQGKFSRLPQSQDENYIRYTVARLSAFRNVWWTLTNEFDLYPQFGIYKDWRALGNLLAASDPFDHLRGIHNSCVGFYDNSESWITHVILQDITLQRLTAVQRNDSAMGLSARGFGKPVVIDEYGYEGNIAMTWGSLAPREAVEMHWSIVMAGAYGSHGESYFKTPHGELVGEAPARLFFLKQIMAEAPFHKLEPLPTVISSEDPSITVLGTPGSYYIFHFDQPKEKASWNLGFFGPATPAQPLPIVNRSVDPNTWRTQAPKFTIVEGVYRVEMIDTWQMKVHHVGFTSGVSQQFRSLIEPGLVRLIRVDSAPAEEAVLPIDQLLQRYASPF